MAYIKIFPIKSTVDHAVKYITNPNKTDSQNLVSSFACAPETAAMEFAYTEEMGKRNNMDKGDNLAWHMIISFKPGEITDPAIAQEVGEKIAEAALKGKYEYVLSVHTDKDHVHCHLIFNATSFVDHHKYHSNKKSYRRLCMLSNRICREYGLNENMPTGERSRSYKENMEYKRGNSWKAKLKFTVDRTIWSSVTYEEFLMKMQTAGYEIRQGKYLAFKHPEQKHFINVKTLGSYYTEDSILSRLEKNRTKAQLPKFITREFRIFRQMTVYIDSHDKPGYERYCSLHNLQQAAKTYNYLSEHNLLNYDDFLQHVSDAKEAKAVAEQALQNCNKALEQQQIIQKKCNAYRMCRDIIQGENNAADPAAYRKAHAQEYRLHDALLQELKDLGITKLPSADKLDRQLEELQKERTALKAELKKHDRNLETLSVIQSNFEVLLEEAGVDISHKDQQDKCHEPDTTRTQDVL